MTKVNKIYMSELGRRDKNLADVEACHKKTVDDNK